MYHCYDIYVVQGLGHLEIKFFFQQVFKAQGLKFQFLAADLARGKNNPDSRELYQDIYMENE